MLKIALSIKMTKMIVSYSMKRRNKDHKLITWRKIILFIEIFLITKGKIKEFKRKKMHREDITKIE